MKTSVNLAIEPPAGGDYPASVEQQGRNRRNREALLGAGRSIGHAFSARELHERARRDQPRLGLTTAYRAIERWRSDGLVEDAGTRGGEAVFVMCGEDGHHHHLVCVDCGATITLEGCALTPLRDAAAAVGFELSDRALASLPGRCSGCSAR
jgi:Fur family transcriptional regulator, ferric uptake regulator